MNFCGCSAGRINRAPKITNPWPIQRANTTYDAEKYVWLSSQVWRSLLVCKMASIRKATLT